MSNFKFDARARLSVELALSAADESPSEAERQEAKARALGMSGAEIDVARQGRSFEVVISAAITLAVAVGTDRAKARTRAAKAGITPAIREEIESFAAAFRSTRETRSIRHA